jgi:hypothetical protein
VMDGPYATLPGVMLPARGAASLAPMTFLENLEIAADGTIIITSLLDGRLWRVPFDGNPEMLTQIDGRPSSVAAVDDGGWLAFGWTMRGDVAAFRVYADGRNEIFATLPDAVFPNGAQRFPGGHYLLADSVTATIWDVHYPSGAVSIWHRHPTLGPREGAWEPALNGMKVWGDRLYMTNSSTGQVLAMPIADGRPAGEIEVIRDNINADDFAFDVEGTMYLTTHPMDTVLKLTQAGELTRIAGPEQGVRGCTACRFGRVPGDETGLYVVTDGGLFNPRSGDLKPAQVVRLETGIAGASVDLI